jgi:hypothetical protein
VTYTSIDKILDFLGILTNFERNYVILKMHILHISPYFPIRSLIINLEENFYQYFSVLLAFTPTLMYKFYFLTYLADVVAFVTLNYQLIQNSLEFENLIFLFKN